MPERALKPCSLRPVCHLITNHARAIGLCDGSMKSPPDVTLKCGEPKVPEILYALSGRAALSGGCPRLRCSGRSELHPPQWPFADIHEGSISRSIGLVWRKGAGRSNAYSDLANFIRDVVSSEFESLTPE